MFHAGDFKCFLTLTIGSKYIIILTITVKREKYILLIKERAKDGVI